MLGYGDLVKEFLTKYGPSLPVEIGKTLGYNSLLTKAVLIELVNNNTIRQSKRTIGNSLLYYLPGQEGMLRKKLYEDLKIPEKHALETFRNSGRPMQEEELSPQERFIIRTLQDFIDLQMINNVRYYSLKGVEQRAPLPPVAPVVIEPRVQEPVLFARPEPVLEPPKPAPAPRKEETPVIKKKAEKEEDEEAVEGFDHDVLAYLKKLGEVELQKVVRRDRETNYILKVSKPIEQVFFVKSKNKSRINESDLSLIYAETLQEKKPGLLVTKGDFTSTAKKWKDEKVGELIRLIRI